MQNRTRIIIFLFILSFSFLPKITNAQLNSYSSISGIVTDSNSKEPLFGANLFLRGTSLGVSTDFDGKFSIKNIPPGEYDLVVSYIGYNSVTLPITFSGKTIEQNISLTYEGIMLGEELIVSAQAEGQMDAINQQISSTSISNVVSADRIQELPDANAAESVGRLPGVSIVRSGGEGNSFVIRGMSSRYNTVTINGVRMPSTQFEDRGSSVSMISSNALEGIVLTKTLTPDKDADATGGGVEFKLRKANKGFTSQFRLQGGYNSLVSSIGRYKSDFSVGNRFFDNSLGLQILANYEKSDRSSDNLRARYFGNIQQEEGDTDPLYEALTDNFQIEDRNEKRERFGGTVILDYEFDKGSLLLTNFISRENMDIESRASVFNIDETDFVKRINNPDQSQQIYQNSLNGDFDLGWGNIDFTFAHSYTKNHEPTANQWNFGAAASAYYASNKLELQQMPISLVQNFVRTDTFNIRLLSGTRINRMQEQRNFTAQTNIEIPITLDRNYTGKIKFGGKFRNQNRNYDYNSSLMNFLNGEGFTAIFDYKPDWIVTGRHVSLKNFVDNDYNNVKILEGKYLMDVNPRFDMMNRISKDLSDMYLSTVWDNRNDYKNKENVYAGYLMTEINFGPNIMLLPGIRYEYEDSWYKAKYAVFTGGPYGNHTIKDSTSYRKQGRWFPMITARVKPTEWFDLRFAYTESLSRPSYTNLAPRVLHNVDESEVTLGNPSLKPMLFKNYDFFASFYGNKIGLFTVGLFYKNITNQFYNLSIVALDPAADGLDEKWKNVSVYRPNNNTSSGSVKGIEFDVQTHLWYLPFPFNGLVLQANITFIESKIDYFTSSTRQVPINIPPFSKSVRDDTSWTGQLLDQPDIVANVAVGYDYRDFSARVSVNYQGTTLDNINRTDATTDGYTDGRTQWDLSVKQKITDKIEIFGNLTNFTDQPDNSFIRQGHRPTSLLFFGMTGDIGISVKL